MKAQYLRTVVISRTALVDVTAALALLQNGLGLTAVQSGVNIELPIANLDMIDQVALFDGFKYTVFLFVTAG